MIGVTQIWERLFLGGLYDAERLGRANPLGIMTVVSLSQAAPCNMRREINYIHLPVEDTQAIPAASTQCKCIPERCESEVGVGTKNTLFWHKPVGENKAKLVPSRRRTQAEEKTVKEIPGSLRTHTRLA
jgi:hypothetical protein